MQAVVGPSLDDGPDSTIVDPHTLAWVGFFEDLIGRARNRGWIEHPAGTVTLGRSARRHVTREDQPVARRESDRPLLGRHTLDRGVHVDVHAVALDAQRQTWSQVARAISFRPTPVGTHRGDEEDAFRLARICEDETVADGERRQYGLRKLQAGVRGRRRW